MMPIKEEEEVTIEEDGSESNDLILTHNKRFENHNFNATRLQANTINISNLQMLNNSHATLFKYDGKTKTMLNRSIMYGKST
jgi:hypothetical protein